MTQVPSACDSYLRGTRETTDEESIRTAAGSSSEDEDDDGDEVNDDDVVVVVGAEDVDAIDRCCRCRRRRRCRCWRVLGAAVGVGRRKGRMGWRCSLGAMAPRASRIEGEGAFLAAERGDIITRQVQSQGQVTVRVDDERKTKKHKAAA